MFGLDEGHLFIGGLAVLAAIYGVLWVREQLGIGLPKLSLFAGSKEEAARKLVESFHHLAAGKGEPAPGLDVAAESAVNTAVARAKATDPTVTVAVDVSSGGTVSVEFPNPKFKGG
jgi:hypothetical protein